MESKIELLTKAVRDAKVELTSIHNSVLSDYALTETQWLLLRALKEAKVPTSAKYLIEFMRCKGPSNSRIIKCLSNQDLIFVEPNKGDFRGLLISLTESGNDLHKEIIKKIRAKHRKLEKRIGSENIDLVVGILNKEGNFDG